MFQLLYTIRDEWFNVSHSKKVGIKENIKVMTKLNRHDAPKIRINGSIFSGKRIMPYVNIVPSSPKVGDGKSHNPAITPIMFNKEANHELKIIISIDLWSGIGFLQ